MHKADFQFMISSLSDVAGIPHVCLEALLPYTWPDCGHLEISKSVYLTPSKGFELVNYAA